MSKNCLPQTTETLSATSTVCVPFLSRGRVAGSRRLNGRKSALDSSAHGRRCSVCPPCGAQTPTQDRASTSVVAGDGARSRLPGSQSRRGPPQRVYCARDSLTLEWKPLRTMDETSSQMVSIPLLFGRSTWFLEMGVQYKKYQRKHATWQFGFSLA